MFSFFKKKPPASPLPPPALEKREEAAAPQALEPQAAEPQALEPQAAGERRRGTLGWLNADVGELFFGKKPSTESPIEATAAAPPPAPVPATAAAGSAAAEHAAAKPEIGPDTDVGRASWVTKLKSGLRRTGASFADAFVGAEITDELYEDLEAALLQADAGSAAARYLLDDLELRVTRADIRHPAGARRLLARCVEDLLAPLEKPLVIGEHTPTIIMVVGVNGAGKTTSVGKLARHLIDADRKVLLAAADTFRAAAREQLLAWAERAGTASPGSTSVSRGAGHIEIVSQQGGDPAGVTFDAVVAGKSRGCDVVIADTAGRLATQAHLMEELKKIHRTIGKAQAGAPHEVLLVIDGNTGQNALAQVQAFDAALPLTGLIITKLDGTAKGGVLAAIALWSRERAQPLPVYFVGVGEKLADLQTFRAGEFADALVG